MCSEMSRDTIKNVEEWIWKEGMRRFRGELFEQAHVDAMSPEKQKKKDTVSTEKLRHENTGYKVQIDLRISQPINIVCNAQRDIYDMV